MCYVCLSMLWISDYQIHQHFKYIGLFCECGSIYAIASGLLWWLSGKRTSQAMRRQGFSLWVLKIPCRRKWQPTPVFLPGKSHGPRSLELGPTIHGVPRVGHDLVTKLPPPFAITASLQILHLNEHCVELKIPWSGQRSFWPGILLIQQKLPSHSRKKEISAKAFQSYPIVKSIMLWFFAFKLWKWIRYRENELASKPEEEHPQWRYDVAPKSENSLPVCPLSTQGPAL